MWKLIPASVWGWRRFSMGGEGEDAVRVTQVHAALKLIEAVGTGAGLSGAAADPTILMCM